MKTIIISIFLLAGTASLQAQTNNNPTQPGNSPTMPQNKSDTINKGADKNQNPTTAPVPKTDGGTSPSNKKSTRPDSTGGAPMDPNKNKPMNK